MEKFIKRIAGFRTNTRIKNHGGASVLQATAYT